MTALVPYSAPSPDEWGQLAQTAKAIAETDFVPRAVRGNPGAVLATLLTGRELGIGPMQALREVYVIEGKPTMSAQLMASLIRRAGHKLVTVTSADDEAHVIAYRAGEPDMPLESVFTMADAQRAGLVNKDVWKKYPRSLLWARAVTQLARREFSEVLCGVKYTAEEAGSIGVTAEWGEPEPAETSGSSAWSSEVEAPQRHRKEGAEDPDELPPGLDPGAGGGAGGTWSASGDDPAPAAAEPVRAAPGDGSPSGAEPRVLPARVPTVAEVIVSAGHTFDTVIEVLAGREGWADLGGRNAHAKLKGLRGARVEQLRLVLAEVGPSNQAAP